MEELLEAGYASDVVDLCEEAIALLEEALNAIDDSDGHLNDILDQLPDLHFRACTVAPPNPRALAERLFRRELASGYGFFYNALETYGDLLGDEGRETYRQLVDEEWNKLPVLDARDRQQYDYRRSQLSRMKEALVAETGNLEALVTVIAKDLSSPSRYLQIARRYQNANQVQEAIAWAERGIQAFEGSYLTGQLGDFLIEAYEQTGRFEDAAAIVWQDFAHHPSLFYYQKLKQ